MTLKEKYFKLTNATAPLAGLFVILLPVIAQLDG
jgi:hypothetical protein